MLSMFSVSSWHFNKSIFSEKPRRIASHNKSTMKLTGGPFDMNLLSKSFCLNNYNTRYYPAIFSLFKKVESYFGEQIHLRSNSEIHYTSNEQYNCRGR